MSSGYSAPPPTTPPPEGWRPRRIVEPAPPRQLPAQDHAALDADEEQARSVTRTLGWIAGGALLLVLILLCGRLLF